MHGYGSHIARTLTCALLVGGAVSQSMTLDMPQTDVPNSKDSPIVSRFAGSTIVAYQQVDYDEVALPMGPRTSPGLRRRSRPRGK